MGKPGEPDEGIDSLVERAFRSAAPDEPSGRKTVRPAGGAATPPPTGTIRLAPGQPQQAGAAPPRGGAEAASLMEMLPFGLLVTDQAGMVRATNGVARRLFGVGEGVLEGRRVIDLFEPTDRGALASLIDDAFRGRPAREVQLAAHGVPGPFPASVSAAGAFDGDRRLRQVVWTVRESAASQAALDVQVHGSKVEVLAELGLELGREASPVIARITEGLVSAQRLLSPDPDEVRQVDRGALRDRITDATSGVLRIQEFVAELERFAATPPLKLEAVDPAEILARAQKLLARSLRSHRVRLRNEMDDPAPRLQADASRLTEIVVNLLRNARNALSRRFDGGDPDASASTKRLIIVESFVKDPYVVLAFSNNGVPVAATDQERIFLPSFQARDPDRTGLGLPETAALMKQMGGAIQCESLGDAGTRFLLTLPHA